MSPCLIHNAHDRSRTTPAQEKLNFVVLVQLLLNGGRGMWDRPASPTRSRWGSGQGQRLGGLPRALHPCTVPTPVAADASPFPGVLVEQAETLLRPPARCSSRLLSRRSLCCQSQGPTTLQKLAVPCSSARLPLLGNGWPGWENSKFPPPSDLLPSTASS